jgi:hypothetical protein
MPESFPQGVVVFFRQMTPDNSFARSVHPRGRKVVMNSRTMEAHEDDYIVLDAEDNFLGAYPRDYVAAILPLETTGPGTAPDARNTPLNS